MKLIDKSALVAEIEKLYNGEIDTYTRNILDRLKSNIDSIEVIDPYEQCIQYASIEGGIKAQAEDYSFNIESELFNQLTKEQQVLWRKEIEQACISGGYSGYSLAKDPRYKENLEVKEVDFEKVIEEYFKGWTDDYDNGGAACHYQYIQVNDCKAIAKHFFELGFKVQKGEII